MRRLLFILFLVFILQSKFAIGQYNGNHWCFGDSAYIDWSNPQNPLVGGPGVLMARVLLNLEIYDEPMSGTRIRNVPSEVTSEILFEVYPIPTHQLLSIRTNVNTENAHLKIQSIDGRMLWNSNYQNQVDIADLSEGVYFLTLESENISSTVKFVKI